MGYGTVPTAPYLKNFLSFQVMNPLFSNTVSRSYEHTRTPTVPSGHWLASLLVQHASRTKGVYDSKTGVNISHKELNVARSKPVRVIIP
jgi:hypothetical protein